MLNKTFEINITIGDTEKKMLGNVHVIPDQIVTMAVDGIVPGKPLPQNFLWSITFECPMDTIHQYFPDVLATFDKMAASGPGVYHSDSDNDNLTKIMTTPSPRSIGGLIDPQTGVRLLDLVREDPTVIDNFNGLGIDFGPNGQVMDITIHPDPDKPNFDPIPFVAAAWYIGLNLQNRIIMDNAVQIGRHLVDFAPLIGDHLYTMVKKYLAPEISQILTINKIDSLIRLNKISNDSWWSENRVLVLNELENIFNEFKEKNHPESHKLAKMIRLLGQGITIIK